MTKKTNHFFFNQDSSKIDISDNSIHLVLTSPPYPMIEMWDYLYLKNFNYETLFEDTHKKLDIIWEEMSRVLIFGGIVCINIGDATRTINNNFKLYSNKTRIIYKMQELGFSLLPGIIWSKPTNSPNKFMGSGMLPVNAYVSLGHEHILVFRKGSKREFNIHEQKIRRESSFFWAERNIWFSDIWNINGIKQNISITSRKKSAAFPSEISDRLISMFSIKGDFVLDPFGGTGTTIISAIKLQRNSYYYDIDFDLLNLAIKNIPKLINKINEDIQQRIDKNFLSKEDGNYFNDFLNYWVKTKSEKNLTLLKIISTEIRDLKNGNFNLIFEYQ